MLQEMLAELPFGQGIRGVLATTSSQSIEQMKDCLVAGHVLYQRVPVCLQPLYMLGNDSTPVSNCLTSLI